MGRPAGEVERRRRPAVWLAAPLFAWWALVLAAYWQMSTAPVNRAADLTAEVPAVQAADRLAPPLLALTLAAGILASRVRWNTAGDSGQSSRTGRRHEPR